MQTLLFLSATLLRAYFDPTPAPDESFGESVLAFGSDVLVGAPAEDSAAPNAGRAYRFDAAGRLLAVYQSGLASEGLGRSLAVVGGRVAVGAPGHVGGAGAGVGRVYLFDRDGRLARAVENPHPTMGDYFGHTLSAVGPDSFAAGGLFYSDLGEVDLMRDDGRLVREMGNPEPRGLVDFFGGAVASWRGYTVVGASHQESTGGEPTAGAAYLFESARGELLRTFEKPSPARGDAFGVSVAVVGDRVVVGAQYDDSAGPPAGAVYVFDIVTAALVMTLRDPTPAAGDEFGGAVAAVGENILVGAAYDDAAGPDAGAAHLFDGRTGALLATFTNPTPDAEHGAGEGDGDLFGWSVAGVPDGAGGWSVLVGAPWDDTHGEDAGAAYLFAR